MDYNKMVGLYKWLPISISYLDVLTKSKFVNIRQLNEPLYDLVNSYEFEMIDNIIVTKDGMKFNLNKIKKVLCEYFNVDQNNIIESLENAEKNINIKMSDLMIKTFNSYRLKKYMPNKSKISTINRAKKKEFLTKTRRDIRRFKNLILNEDKYSIVNDSMFNEDRVCLFLAHIIMDYAEYYKKDETKYINAIEYLQNYINLNKHLVEDSFSFSCVGYKKYSINTIFEYVKKNEKYAIKEELLTFNTILMSDTKRIIDSRDFEGKVKKYVYKKCSLCYIFSFIRYITYYIKYRINHYK